LKPSVLVVGSRGLGIDYFRLKRSRNRQKTPSGQLGQFGKGKNQIPEKYYLFTAVIKIDL